MKVVALDLAIESSFSRQQWNADIAAAAAAAAASSSPATGEMRWRHSKWACP